MAYLGVRRHRETDGRTAWTVTQILVVLTVLGFSAAGWGICSDHTHEPEWNSKMKDVAKLADASISLGTRYAARTAAGRRRPALVAGAMLLVAGTLLIVLAVIRATRTSLPQEASP